MLKKYFVHMEGHDGIFYTVQSPSIQTAILDAETEHMERFHEKGTAVSVVREDHADRYTNTTRKNVGPARRHPSVIKAKIGQSRPAGAM